MISSTRGRMCSREVVPQVLIMRPSSYTNRDNSERTNASQSEFVCIEGMVHRAAARIYDHSSRPTVRRPDEPPIVWSCNHFS